MQTFVSITVTNRMLFNDQMLRFEALFKLVLPAVSKILTSVSDVVANDFNEITGKVIESRIGWKINGHVCTFTNSRTLGFVKVTSELFAHCIKSSDNPRQLFVISGKDKRIPVETERLELNECEPQVKRIRRLVDCEQCELANLYDRFDSPRATKCLRLGLWFCCDHECDCPGPHVNEPDYLDPAVSDSWAHFSILDDVLDCRCEECSADCDLLVDGNKFICRWCKEGQGAHTCFSCQTSVYPEDPSYGSGATHAKCGRVCGINSFQFYNFMRLLNAFVDVEFEQIYETAFDALDSYSPNGRLFPVEAGRWIRDFNLPSSSDRFPVAVESVKELYFAECEQLNRLVSNIRKSSDITGSTLWNLNKLIRFTRVRRAIGIQSDVLVMPRIDPYPVGFSPISDKVLGIASKCTLPEGASAKTARLIYMSRLVFGIITSQNFLVYGFGFSDPLYSYTLCPSAKRSRNFATLGSPSNAILIASREGTSKFYYALTLHVGLVRKSIPLIAKNTGSLRLRFSMNAVTDIVVIPHKSYSFVVGFWISEVIVGFIEVEIIRLLESSIDVVLKPFNDVDPRLMDCFWAKGWSIYMQYPHWIAPDYSKLLYLVYDPSSQSYQQYAIDAEMICGASTKMHEKYSQFHKSGMTLSLLRMRGPNWITWFNNLPLVTQTGWMIPNVRISQKTTSCDFGYYSTMTLRPEPEPDYEDRRVIVDIYTSTLI